MEYVQAFWLAFIQGITEFLPISSSGHLVLVQRLLELDPGDLSFEEFEAMMGRGLRAMA